MQKTLSYKCSAKSLLYTAQFCGCVGIKLGIKFQAFFFNPLIFNITHTDSLYVIGFDKTRLPCTYNSSTSISCNLTSHYAIRLFTQLYHLFIKQQVKFETDDILLLRVMNFHICKIGCV